MDVRPLDPDAPHELDAVLALFQLVYRSEMSRAMYRWRFLDNPFGPPLVSLLWDGETLAGHYAASPMRAWLGAPIAAAQSMTTMTHPAYRNRGVFTLLANDLYRRMERELGVQMIWGLPNTQSHYGFTTKLGWRDVGLAFTMTKLLGDEARDVAIEASASPPANATELFLRSDDGRVFPSARDAPYLHWRYVANPVQTYTFFTLPARDDVLAIGKTYATRSGERALELVDYLYAREPKSLGALLDGVLGWARREGHAMVRTWMAMTDPAFGQLEKLGFVPKEPLAYFGARTFGAFAIPEAKWCPAGFAITMGDSDNY